MSAITITRAMEAEASARLNDAFAQLSKTANRISDERNALLTALKALVFAIENPKARRASIDAHLRSANAAIAAAEASP